MTADVFAATFLAIRAMLTYARPWLGPASATSEPGITVFANDERSAFFAIRLHFAVFAKLFLAIGAVDFWHVVNANIGRPSSLPLGKDG